MQNLVFSHIVIRKMPPFFIKCISKEDALKTYELQGDTAVCVISSVSEKDGLKVMVAGKKIELMDAPQDLQITHSPQGEVDEEAIEALIGKEDAAQE